MTTLGFILFGLFMLIVGIVCGRTSIIHQQKVPVKIIYKDDRDGREIEQLENTISDLRQSREDDLYLIRETLLLNKGLEEHVRKLIGP